MREKKAKEFFVTFWRCIVLEPPDVLWIGCDEDNFSLCSEIGKNGCLHATLLEDALLLLQENSDVVLIVVDCRGRTDENSVAAARTLRQNGFSGWMIAVCVKNGTKRSPVQAEFDLSCSKDEICDVVKSLMGESTASLQL